jgi:hypothetical protein
MPESKSNSDDLVTTQANLPPGIDAPPPPGQNRLIVGADIPADLERDIRQLAKRAGGFARLGELVRQMELASR